MTKTDSPVRAHSEENEGYKAFTKDKRTRTFRSTTAEYSTRNHNFDGEGGEKRRSYNPNFTKDNQLTDRNKRQAEYNRERNFNRESGERTFNRDERGGYNRGERTFGNREGGYNRERTFNREERGGFNRERNFGGGYNKGGYGNRDRNFNREGGERTFNREERSYNHDGGEQHSFNREERGYNRSERNFGNREGGYNRERSFNREGGERNFNREERGGFNRERNFGGGFNRERSFNREGGNRNFNREGGERTFGKGGFGKGAPHSKPRAQRTEGKSYVNTANHYTIENYPSYATPEQDGAIRLNRYISMSGLCSRREADEYITAGSITVNGQVVTELGTKVMPGDVVCHNGEQLQNEKKVYIVMNKPKGFVTTLDDPHADKSVMDLVKNAGFGKGAPHSKPRAQRTEGKSYVNTANHYTIENYPSYATPEQDGAIRLNRYISMSGLCSRREADEYITAGSITVNGQVVTELGTKVMPGDVVCHNGEQLQNEKKVYIVMNKPKGFVTTLDDPHADKSVMDLVKNACTERIYPVGRLDKNSVGVLLLTNDGDLAKKLTHPTYEKKKIYQVSLDKHLTRADMEQLILGITLEDGDIAADDICYVEDPKMKNAVGIEIHSGRNRIVRRMFEHLGYHVGKLDRVYFAGLTKQKLKRGEWRFLTEKEVGMLKSGSYE